MKNWATAFTNTSGSFPNILAVNVSTPGAGDGTEFISDLINDFWGWMQHMVNGAGLTPSGSLESSSASQVGQALRHYFGAPGEVVMWQGQADPATAGIRLLLLQGQGVLRATYSDLDYNCYVGDANNSSYEAYYRATDSAGTNRSTTGSYLILPDMRGLVPRGHDPAAVNDPLGTSRLFPDYQAHSLEEHLHNVISSNPAYRPVDLVGDASGTGDALLSIESGTEASTDLVASDSPLYSCNYNSVETRMKNFQVKFAVRY